jgi:hypothetical protein
MITMKSTKEARSPPPTPLSPDSKNEGTFIEHRYLLWPSMLVCLRLDCLWVTYIQVVFFLRNFGSGLSGYYLLDL